MNLIMMGTGDFAVPTCRLLLDRGYPVRLLVTQPDRPQGRHQELVAATIKAIALDRDIDVFQPERMNDAGAIAHLDSFRPDLLVVAAYGQILSDDVLATARQGGINLHASLLPKYRGAAPINWAIYHGETVTGVTVIRMTPRVDAGAIVMQAETPIGPDETAGELETRLAELGAPLVCQTIDDLAAGTCVERKQDRSQVTRAPKLSKEHGLIDWSRTAAEIRNHIRAMQPWPMAYSFLHRRGKPPERMLLDHAELESPIQELAPARAGEIVAISENSLFVQAGGGSRVVISCLRPAGKRTMMVREFLRGKPVQPGDRFESERSPDR